MKNSIKFVYFDIGNVIYEFRGGLQKLSALSHVAETDLFNLFLENDDDRCRGKKTLRQFWNRCKMKFNLEHIKINDFEEFFVDHFTPIYPTHQLIEKLSKFYKIGLLTNISKGLLKKALKKKYAPLIDYHAIVESCDIGFVKPEKEIFMHAQDRAKVKPKEIFFIDDLSTNIEMAIQLGWDGFIFDKDNPQKSIEEIGKILLTF